VASAGARHEGRRLITVACVAYQDAPIPILSHVYAALKSRDVSFDEMDEVALHFGAYYGWAKASHLSQTISEQKQRVLDEWRAPYGGYKQRGFGRAGGLERLHEFLQVKNIRIGVR